MSPFFSPDAPSGRSSTPVALPSWSMARPSLRPCARRSCRRGAPSSSSAGTSTAAPSWWATSRRPTGCRPTWRASSPSWWRGGPSCGSICCCWDYSLLYAHEREPLPRLYLNWQMPPQVTFCLDSTVPFGSSQHQKLVVVDDALAFSGGLDLTDPALGHQPSRARQPQARRSGRRALSAVPRRADDGRRRGGACAGAAGARPLVPCQGRRARARAGGRSVAARPARRISPTSRSPSRAPSRAIIAKTRCARSRRCSSRASRAPSARSTSRTSS